MVGRAASRGYDCPLLPCAEACFDGGQRHSCPMGLAVARVAAQAVLCNAARSKDEELRDDDLLQQAPRHPVPTTVHPPARYLASSQRNPTRSTPVPAWWTSRAPCKTTSLRVPLHARGRSARSHWPFAAALQQLREQHLSGQHAQPRGPLIMYRRHHSSAWPSFVACRSKASPGATSTTRASAALRST